MKQIKSILFLGETYRADAQSWILGIEKVSGIRIQTMEVQATDTRLGRILKFMLFGLKILGTNFGRSYDLVLAERATSYGLFSLFVNAEKRVVAQQGITDAFPETGFSGIYKRFFQKIVYKNVDLIHAWGEVMVPAMLGSGAKPNKIMILPKGLDLHLYQFPEENVKEADLAIVTRSLTSVYHHEDILKAIAILKNDGIKLNLIIIGDGPLRETLQQQNDELGLNEQVKFEGRIPNTKLPSYLSKASIYISVPETEGVSASLFEAMASGCFPIVSDLPGSKAFIKQGENGYLVPVNRPDAIAAALKKYLDESEANRKLVIQNRKFIEENVDRDQNMKKIYTRYLQLFEK